MSWACLGPFWACLGASWACHGDCLGVSWAVLRCQKLQGSLLGCLGLFWGLFLAVLGRQEACLGPRLGRLGLVLGCLGPTWACLGDCFGLSWVSGALRVVFGRYGLSWAVLDLSWAVFGRLRPVLGIVLGCLRPSGSPKVGRAWVALACLWGLLWAVSGCQEVQGGGVEPRPSPQFRKPPVWRFKE